MGGVFHRAGEGQALFGGRIVIKADFEQLCITESEFARARPGAGPHLHRRHTDSFYVLEGELALLVHDEEHPLRARGVRVPAARRRPRVQEHLGGPVPQLPHAGRRLRGAISGRSTAARRAASTASTSRVGSGLPASGATVLAAGEGERLEGETRVATIKIGRDELTLIEFELEPSFEGPDPHTHDDHVDAFYVLEGEVEFRLGDEKRLGRRRLVRRRAARESCTRSRAGPGAVGCSIFMRRAPALASGSGRTASPQASA